MSNADIVTPFGLIQQTCRLVTVCPGSSQRRSVAPPGQLRTFLAMNPTMTTTHPVDDRHTFLKPQEVIARYRWGRTRGYLELKKANFPRPIGGNYRLDTLTAWEDRWLTGPCKRGDQGDGSGRAGFHPVKDGAGKSSIVRAC
jgi:hypothetical protein